jgi:hypothetical protein
MINYLLLIINLKPLHMLLCSHAFKNGGPCYLYLALEYDGEQGLEWIKVHTQLFITVDDCTDKGIIVHCAW